MCSKRYTINVQLPKNLSEPPFREFGWDAPVWVTETLARFRIGIKRTTVESDIHLKKNYVNFFT